MQAYENDEVLSSEEQARAEQERRAEIAEKYSIYEPYGMTYDTEKDRFFYNGQVVRYFKDQINSNETNGFSYDDGVIDVEPIRDEDGSSLWTRSQKTSSEIPIVRTTAAAIWSVIMPTVPESSAAANRAVS